MQPIYPNLFVLLVSPPGVGKSVSINVSSALLKHTRKIAIAPATMTKAALVDTISDAEKNIRISGGEGGKVNVYTYSSLAIPNAEFGTLVPSQDLVFLNTLNDLFDCRPDYVERTRGNGVITLTNPQISILSGTQPDYLQTILPAEAWGMGFTSRLIMVYSEHSERKSLFAPFRAEADLMSALASDLKSISELPVGEFQWDPDAAEAYDKWYLSGCEPKPEVHRLENYNARRHIHLLKLMMIASLARGNDLVIAYEDFETALDWLQEAEETMPHIFRAMTVTGDAAKQEDIKQWMLEEEMKRGHALPEHTITNFARTRANVRDVKVMLEVLKESQIIRQVGLDKMGKPLYSARPDGVTYTVKGSAQVKSGSMLALPSPPHMRKPMQAKYILRVEEEEEPSLFDDEEFYPNEPD